MKIFTILFILLILNISLSAQNKSIAITMDDLFLAFNNIDIKNIEIENDSLLNSISKLCIPVTVFVNEKSFIKIGETDQRLTLFNKWIVNPFITIGNHTYSHKNYSETELASFEEDIIQGEVISKELLKSANKSLKYFRFPFNCTGKDSVSKADIYQYLENREYTITPFTVESSDYMYNAAYCNYIKKGNIIEANKIIEKYIDFTTNLFQYFEDVTNKLYGRNIKHIFLCHTNLLNATCFEKLIMRLKEKDYTFISLEEALMDKIYKNKDYYTEKYGISWIYRWIENREARIKLMRKEPEPNGLEQ